MTITSIRLQSDLEPSLEKLATKLHRSKNWLINQAIRDYIEKDQIESNRWEETLLALESVKNGKGIPEEKVDIWLQSWGTKNEQQAPEL